MSLSPAIDEAVALAEGEGNAVKEVSTGWTKVREVVHMARPISDDVQQRIARDTRLRYWTVDPTPHNRPERGFTDDHERVSISFPVEDHDADAPAVARGEPAA